MQTELNLVDNADEYQNRRVLKIKDEKMKDER